MYLLETGSIVERYIKRANGFYHIFNVVPNQIKCRLYDVERHVDEIAISEHYKKGEPRILKYDSEARPSHWNTQEDHLLLNHYMCGDNSYCCCMFYLFSRVSMYDKEKYILCHSCYEQNQNSTSWLPFQMCRFNDLICHSVHVHMQNHLHCFNCLKDCSSYRCELINIPHVSYKIKYWQGFLEMPPQ